MIALFLGWASLAVWGLLAAGGFWTCRARDARAPYAGPASWPSPYPSVTAIVPARNEADVIARSLAGLAAQTYPGPFRIVLVDDNSTDGTGALARALAAGPRRPQADTPPRRPQADTTVAGGERITVLAGAPLGQGWTGKLWALHQGIGFAEAEAPDYLWLTDADIDHAPDTLIRLVGIAQGGRRRLVSFMARLHCAGGAEAAMVPAFIWFFMMLYPFNWINRNGPAAGAAGGCVLVEREALAQAGGIAAMRGALIDDCTLGRLIKRHAASPGSWLKGGPVWLGLTERSLSIRPYAGLREIGAMIARSAYAQLRYSPILLILTVTGLALMFAVPPALLLAGSGMARLLGGAAMALMMLIYQPILRFYRRSPAWALALPAIAGFYAGCTLASAWAWYRGKGGMWKGRAQAAR